MQSCVSAVDNFVLASDDVPAGSFLVACSSVTGRLWKGSVMCFEEPVTDLFAQKARAVYEADVSISKARWVKDGLAVIGCDDGALGLLRFVPDEDRFGLMKSVTRHDNVISDLSVSKAGDQAAACSYDGRVSVWDTHKLEPLHVYKGHTGIVWSVSCCQENASLILSAGQHGELLLWDTRLPKPASRINTDVSPTCCCWLPGSDQKLVLGTASGGVQSLDVRLGVVNTAQSGHTRPVTTLKFNPQRASQLLSASEDCSVLLHKLDELASFTTTETLGDHTDMVLDAVWAGSDVYTCGFRNQIQRHSVQK